MRRLTRLLVILVCCVVFAAIICLAPPLPRRLALPADDALRLLPP